MEYKKKQITQEWMKSIQKIQHEYTEFYKQLPQPLTIELPEPSVIKMNELMFQSYSLHFMELFLKEHSIQPITFKEANRIDPSVDITGWAYNPQRYHDHWLALIHQLQRDINIYHIFQRRYGTIPLYNDECFDRKRFISWFLNFFYQAIQHISPTASV